MEREREGGRVEGRGGGERVGVGVGAECIFYERSMMPYGTGRGGGGREPSYDELKRFVTRFVVCVR